MYRHTHNCKVQSVCTATIQKLDFFSPKKKCTWLQIIILLCMATKIMSREAPQLSNFLPHDKNFHKRSEQQHNQWVQMNEFQVPHTVH